MSLRFQGVGGGGTRAHEEVTQKWLSWECVLGRLCLGLSDRPEHMAEELSPPFLPSGGLVSTPGCFLSMPLPEGVSWELRFPELYCRLLEESLPSPRPVLSLNLRFGKLYGKMGEMPLKKTQVPL